VTLSGVMGETWALYRHLFARTVIVAALIFGVLDLLRAWSTQVESRDAVAALIALTGLLSFAGAELVQGALAEVVRDAHEGREPAPPAELFARTRPVILPLLGATLLGAIGVGIGFVLFIVPGILLWTLWSLIVPVIVYERRGVLESFSRSRQLVRGHGWTVFGVLVVVTLGGGIVAGVIGTLFRFLPDFWAVWVGGVVANSLVTPFTAHALSVMYYRLVEPERPVVADPSGVDRWRSIWDEEAR
jgi:hypothetical protein